MTWDIILREFVTLFVVIDPIGTLPVYLYATAQVPRELHRAFAIRAVGIAAAVLLFFLVCGQLLLEAIGLRLGSFQMAGGIILFLFALTMIFGESKPEREIEEASHDPKNRHKALAGAVFPLAMPSIASPGAMLAVVILTDNHSNPLDEQLMTAGLLVVVLLITLGLLLAAQRLQGVIGTTGASVISRVMGLILATVAVDAVLGGLETLGLLTVQEEGGLELSPE